MLMVNKPEITGGASNRPIVYFLEGNKGAPLVALYAPWRCKAGNWEFVVPEGSVSNFVSMPWPIRSVIRFFISPVDQVLAIPSIAHDYLVNEWRTTKEKRTFIDTVTGEECSEHIVDLTWKDSAKIFIDYADSNYTGKSAYIKSRLVYGLVIAYGFVTGKLNKRVNELCQTKTK